MQLLVVILGYVFNIPYLCLLELLTDGIIIKN